MFYQNKIKSKKKKCRERCRYTIVCWVKCVRGREREKHIRIKTRAWGKSSASGEDKMVNVTLNFTSL